jgi:hypothetical protein
MVLGRVAIYLLFKMSAPGYHPVNPGLSCDRGALSSATVIYACERIESLPAKMLTVFPNGLCPVVTPKEVLNFLLIQESTEGVKRGCFRKDIVWGGFMILDVK